MNEFDGDIQDALEACQELELMLGRLKRQRASSDQDWGTSKQTVTELCDEIEQRLAVA